jgi:integrating conjugative element protein (TIGR03757 family)
MSGSPVSLLLHFAAIALAVGLCPCAWAEAIAFTDSRHPLASTGNVRVVMLDASAQIEATLSANLPPDVDKAAALVRERLAQNPELPRQLAASYQGVLDAYSLGIAKIPAIVVDRRYVIYGEHDVEAALARIAAYRGGAR